MSPELSLVPQMRREGTRRDVPGCWDRVLVVIEGLQLEDSPCRHQSGQPHGGRAHGHVSCSLQQQGTGAGRDKGWSRCQCWCPSVPQADPAALGAELLLHAAAPHIQACFPVNQLISSNIWDSC